MEEIRDQRTNSDGEVEYLLKWVGYDEPTWEAESALKADQALSEWIEKQKEIGVDASKTQTEKNIARQRTATAEITRHKVRERRNEERSEEEGHVKDWSARRNRINSDVHLAVPLREHHDPGQKTQRDARQAERERRRMEQEHGKNEVMDTDESSSSGSSTATNDMNVDDDEHVSEASHSSSSSTSSQQ